MDKKGSKVIAIEQWQLTVSFHLISVLLSKEDWGRKDFG